MRIVMMGTGTFAEPTFQALLASPRHTVVGLVTNPDRPSGRQREMQRDIKRLALDHQVTVYQPESVNTPEAVAVVQEFRPDLLVVAAYGQILSKDVLAAAPHGGINVHASLLPKYRGAAPINWALYHGETRTGVTIIRMSVRLDAGDQLAQEALDILPDETAGELEDRLAPLGARLAVRVIDQIATGTAQGIKQDPAQVTKAPKLTKEHGLLDWTRHGRDVCNQVRAMQPWPTAYTYWHHGSRGPVRLIINKARWQEGDDGLKPGSAVVVPEEPNRLFVAAGAETRVEIAELQPVGKRRMAAAEFLRGHRPQAGDWFGAEAHANPEA